ncbi:hypothetical protein B0H16DRAFT_1682602 [Mycena metata]|uniref:Uncharacterized protein n=1 Tax=Mycena metata TaxID=1033252 RepID=A0AAD7NZ34_9AGAR|nr:hypothetical protein B0H16DRAFT_1682602 [Mycena metata]
MSQCYSFLPPRDLWVQNPSYRHHSSRYPSSPSWSSLPRHSSSPEIRMRSGSQLNDPPPLLPPAHRYSPYPASVIRSSQCTSNTISSPAAASTVSAPHLRVSSLQLPHGIPLNTHQNWLQRPLTLPAILYLRADPNDFTFIAPTFSRALATRSDSSRPRSHYWLVTAVRNGEVLGWPITLTSEVDGKAEILSGLCGTDRNRVIPLDDGSRSALEACPPPPLDKPILKITHPDGDPIHGFLILCAQARFSTKDLAYHSSRSFSISKMNVAYLEVYLSSLTEAEAIPDVVEEVKRGGGSRPGGGDVGMGGGGRGAEPGGPPDADGDASGMGAAGAGGGQKKITGAARDNHGDDGEDDDDDDDDLDPIEELLFLARLGGPSGPAFLQAANRLSEVQQANQEFAYAASQTRVHEYIKVFGAKTQAQMQYDDSGDTESIH